MNRDDYNYYASGYSLVTALSQKRFFDMEKYSLV